MKKRLLLGIASLAVLATGLASCGPKTTPSSSSSPLSSNTSSPSESSTSSADYPAVTIVMDQTHSLEVGETFRLRAQISEDVTNTTCNFSVDNDEIVEIVGNANGVTNPQIRAKKVGTAKVTATSVINPTVSATCTITVVPAVPTLSELFDAIRDMNNYTLTTTYTHEAVEYTEVTERTENAVVKGITFPNMNDEAKELASEAGYLPIYGGMLSAPGIDDGVARWGSFANKDGAAYIDIKDGAMITPAERVKDSRGFLDAETFDGDGLIDAGYANEFVSTLAAINPETVTDEKSDDNTYELTGSDYNTLNNKIAIMNAVAPYLNFLVIGSVSSDGQYIPTDVANAIDINFAIRSDTDFTITIESDRAGVTATTTISKVNSTSLTIAPSLVNAALESATIAEKALPADLQKVVDDPLLNDYVNAMSDVYFDLNRNGKSDPDTEPTISSITSYYTDDYVISQLLNTTGANALKDYDTLTQGYGFDLSKTDRNNLISTISFLKEPEPGTVTDEDGNPYTGRISYTAPIVYDVTGTGDSRVITPRIVWDEAKTDVFSYGDKDTVISEDLFYLYQGYDTAILFDSALLETLSEGGVTQDTSGIVYSGKDYETNYALFQSVGIASQLPSNCVSLFVQYEIHYQNDVLNSIDIGLYYQDPDLWASSSMRGWGLTLSDFGTGSQNAFDTEIREHLEA